MKKGLTLIEFVIIIALFAAFFIVAYPFFKRWKTTINRNDAIRSLRTLATAQNQYQGTEVTDQDNDGIGEYGLFGELTGTYKCRSANGIQRKKLIPSLLGGKFKPHKGVVKSNGYLFKIYLPGVKLVTDTEGGLKGSAANANFQEYSWRAYAWPIKYGTTGYQILAIDQQLKETGAGNSNQKYSGFEKPIVPDAAGDAECRKHLEKGIYKNEHWSPFDCGI